MSTQIQRRRGTTAEHSTFTGVEGELTVDTTKDTVVVHDGATVGGHPLQKQYPALGSASAPTYTFTGDTNTGIYSPGADQLALSTNGTGRLSIDSSGRVGVGTSAPVHQLSINNATQTQLGLLVNNTEQYRFQALSGNNFIDSINANLNIRTGASGTSASVIIDSSGRVGIKTGSPNQSLHVNGIIQAESSGNYLQLQQATNDSYINNTGSGGIIFRQGTGYTERLRITSAGLVGVGTSSPTQAISIGGVSSTPGDYKGIAFQSGSTEVGYVRSVVQDGNNLALSFGTYNNSLSEKVRITSAGLVGIGTSAPTAELHVVKSTGQSSLYLDRTGGALLYLQGTDSAGVIGTGTNHPVFIRQNGGDAITIDTSKRVGIGTTSPVTKLHVDGDNVEIRASNNANSKNIALYGGSASGDPAITFTNSLRFYSNSAATDRARIDSSGRLLVGTSTSTNNVRVQQNFGLVTTGSGNTGGMALTNYGGTGTFTRPILDFQRSRGTTDGSFTAVASGDMLGSLIFRGADGSQFVDAAFINVEVDGTPGTNDMPGRLVFSTTPDSGSSPVERMRITNGGFITNKTSYIDDLPAGGFTLAPNRATFTSSNSLPMRVNRDSSDGDLITFHQDSVQEGSISVSGSTVSYNGAHLSRWSQLPSGAERIEILRGTVLSNIDEMCEWGDEENEQLNRMKVSNVEGDKNVSGVFQAWDDDDDTYTNDFYCAMTGDFIIRIGAGVVVQRGDLLMSAGDGTAKPQADDLVRSCTVAKVTSTNVSCTYEDGSYCVPCVLMAC